MSFAALLRHHLVVERPYTSEPPELDEYGQPVRVFEDLAATRGLVQPRSEREIALVSQAGAAITDHLIFLPMIDLTTADRLRYDPDDGRRYEVVGIADAGGQGHHLEVSARLIVSSPTEAGS